MRFALRTAVLMTSILFGCGSSASGPIVVSRGESVPSSLSRRSRSALAEYFGREARYSDGAASITIVAVLLDRSFVVAAERARARSMRWPVDRAARELARALAYYARDRLAFEVRVSAAFEEPAPGRFLDLAAWQWTLATGGREPIVSTDAVTTARRSWSEQVGGGYYQGRYWVPEPVTVVRRFETKGVVRFGPPPPNLEREALLGAYPPGVPAVLRLRWRLAPAR
ncbi:MAG: hypothetical protein HYY06_21120 [Deltaproteobacteria bacterium]|nr:hypothetical protein [Deltaproteobacteria bacterium]